MSSHRFLDLLLFNRCYVYTVTETQLQEAVAARRLNWTQSWKYRLFPRGGTVVLDLHSMLNKPSARPANAIVRLIKDLHERDGRSNPWTLVVLESDYEELLSRCTPHDANRKFHSFLFSWFTASPPASDSLKTCSRS